MTSKNKWPVLPADCRWKILKEAGQDKHGNQKCYAQCTCKNKTIKIVDLKNMRFGKSKSCGCLKNELPRQSSAKQRRLNLVLPPDSRWAFISESGHDTKGYPVCTVQCNCIDKTIRIVRKDILKSGKSKSCGCLKSQFRRGWPVPPLDSRWTVLDRTKNKKGHLAFRVQCSCPTRTIKIIRGTAIVSGSSKSCGCLKREITSKVCRREPILPPDSRWTILEEAGRKIELIAYRVQCSCPAKTIKIVSSSNLFNGESKSCGCLMREKVTEGCKKRVPFSKAIEQFGHLADIEETIENIQKEIDPCDSESTNQKRKPSKKPKRSSAVSSTG
jgi:hypothetical protein